MNNKELRKNLKYLINTYISDKDEIYKLKKHVRQLKAKYVLSEIDRLKIREYNEKDIELMKDIFFFYC